MVFNRFKPALETPPTQPTCRTPYRVVLRMGDWRLIQSPDILGSRYIQSGDVHIDSSDSDRVHREASHDHRTRTPRYGVKTCRHEEGYRQRSREGPGVVDVSGTNLGSSRSLASRRTEAWQRFCQHCADPNDPSAMNLCVQYPHIFRL